MGPLADLVPEPEACTLSAEAEKLIGRVKNRQGCDLGTTGMPARTNVKDYLTRLLAAPVVVDEQCLWAQVALAESILTIAAYYLGTAPRLHYVDVWHNSPTTEPPKLSQLWHRDPEDRRILKGFVYLRDVDKGSGPLMYARGTHDRGSAGRVYPPRPPYGRKLRPGVLERKLGEEVRELVGPAGTVILADTAGLHRGGHAQMTSRLLVNFSFTTDGMVPTSQGSKNWVLRHAGSAPTWASSPLALYALGLEAALARTVP